MTKFEEQVQGLMTEVMQDKLESKLMNDDIEDMKLEIEDRDGQLLELQRDKLLFRRQ